MSIYTILYFRRKSQLEDSELKYSGRVHSIRIPPHRIILSGCLLSFSDYTAAHFRYLGEGHQVYDINPFSYANILVNRKYNGTV